MFHVNLRRPQSLSWKCYLRCDERRIQKVGKFNKKKLSLLRYKVRKKFGIRKNRSKALIKTTTTDDFFPPFHVTAFVTRRKTRYARSEKRDGAEFGVDSLP